MRFLPPTISLLTLSLALGTLAYGTMPPHPHLKRMIDEGRIPAPRFLRIVNAFRANGISRPWSSPALRKQRDAAPWRPLRLFGATQPPTGDYNALLILVDFSDQDSLVTAAEFDTLIFADQPGTMRHYFQQVSYGNLDVVTIHLPSAVGWVRADSAYSYYVNGEYGLGSDVYPYSYPNNAQKLVEDVVAAVDDLVDFNPYDNDGDGYVDALFVVHSGPGAEFTGSPNDIWTHSWVTSNEQPVDSVIVWRYSMEPEYWEIPGDMTIGAYAHEAGHSVFGLPDLYDRDGSSAGLGDWSLMSGGSWNGALGDSPAHPDAWSHVQMGYVTPTNLTANVAGQVISQIETSAQAFRLWTAGDIGDEYFLVENRQLVGYDAALPGSGLLIYHVDEAVGADQNDNEWFPGYTADGHYLVALEQADGLWELEDWGQPIDYGDVGDPFPGGTGNTSFDVASVPASRDYASTATDVAVKNISASDSVMLADFMVAPLRVRPPAITAVPDVPADQGGWVAVSWRASPDDDHLSLNPVLFYSLWLRDTEGLLAKRAASDSNPGGRATESVASSGSWSARDEFEGRSLAVEAGATVTGAQEASATARDPETILPDLSLLSEPGWVGVGSLGTTQDSSYTYLVPTLRDSNASGFHWSVIRVSAHTAVSPEGFSFSPVDSGYSVDNIVPGVPAALAATPMETAVLLSWAYDVEAVEDFQYFALYRGGEAGFEPVHPDSALATTVELSYLDDEAASGVTYFYRVAAVDHNGNFSGLSEAVSASVLAVTGGPGLPEEYALRQNYPNPFNPTTTIRFDVPEATPLGLVIYDIRGREVGRLHNGLIEPGYHQVVWNGLTAAGREAPTGMYIVRLVTPAFTRQIKMVLMK